jgi:N-acetylglucosaminyl-diphospho-decaprenol L-rhamnosyltransferase
VSVPTFSVVVVAWNSVDALGPCIGSLRESERSAGRDIEIVVVDNGSSDESAGRARELGADVLVENPVNAGYGVAAAQGMAVASAAWALLLNPDVVVDGGFVGALAAATEAAVDDVATLVPDVRFASDRAIVNCRGIEVDRAGIPADVEAGQRATALEAPRNVFGGSSGACLLRLDAVGRVGGAEPLFFAYGEDVDLAWQLRRAGYRAELVPGAVAYHEGSASMGGESPMKAFLVARSRRLLFRLDGPHTLLAGLQRIPIEFAHTVVMTVLSRSAAPWRGRLDALRARRYAEFVRRSRRLAGGRAEPELMPLRPLRDGLRRKRAVTREIGRE